MLLTRFYVMSGVLVESTSSSSSVERTLQSGKEGQVPPPSRPTNPFSVRCLHFYSSPPHPARLWTVWECPFPPHGRYWARSRVPHGAIARCGLDTVLRSSTNLKCVLARCDSSAYPHGYDQPHQRARKVLTDIIFSLRFFLFFVEEHSRTLQAQCLFEVGMMCLLGKKFQSNTPRANRKKWFTWLNGRSRHPDAVISVSPGSKGN